MTPQEAIKWLNVERELIIEIPQDNSRELKEAYDMAIEALEQQPCEDAISKTELLARIDAERKHLLDIKMDGAEHIVVHHARRIIEDMPSVTPTRPKGEWIEVDVCNCHARLKCSVCDRVIEPVFTFGEYSYEDIKEFYPFCHCGADMR